MPCPCPSRGHAIADGMKPITETLNKTLWECRYFRLRIELESSDPLLCLVRTTERFPSLETLRYAISGVLLMAKKHPQARLMLYDTRAAPGNNDPAFEVEMQRFATDLGFRFDRIALVLGSATGRLHMLRMRREGGLKLEIFLDERAARRYLREIRPKPPEP